MQPEIRVNHVSSGDVGFRGIRLRRDYPRLFACRIQSKLSAIVAGIAFQGLRGGGAFSRLRERNFFRRR